MVCSNGGGTRYREDENHKKRGGGDKGSYLSEHIEKKEKKGGKKGSDLSEHISCRNSTAEIWLAASFRTCNATFVSKMQQEKYIKKKLAGRRFRACNAACVRCSKKNNKKKTARPQIPRLQCSLACVSKMQ